MTKAFCRPQFQTHGGEMKIRSVSSIGSLFVILALGFATQSFAQQEREVANGAHQGTLIEFDGPDASTEPGLGTLAFANNDLGEAVGTYTDTNLVPHGLIRAADGKITSFDAPGAGLGAGLEQGTVAISVNDFGEIAGQFEDPSDVFHGFIRFPNGAFETFDAPGAGTGENQGTLAFNINPQGATAGIYIDESNAQHGFVRSREGKIATFDPPDAVGYTMVCEETCLNGEGVATGFFYDLNSVSHGFLREPDGTITEFSAPGAGTAAQQGTISASINPGGVTSGYFIDSNGNLHGFVRTRAGKFTTFDVPGAPDTVSYTINLLDTVAGIYTDANFAFHGYSRSAFGTYTFFDAPDGGPGAFQGTRTSTNNLEGEVAGWVITASGGNRGFVWQP
jgi:hypothetical protein